MSNDAQATRCGFVAIVGRPNVGKSTLLNTILKQKLSITSRKPQTTRHRIVGIKTQGLIQAVYVDTPGLHPSQKRALNRYMNQAASTAIAEVDVIVFVCDARGWTEQDERVAKQIGKVGIKPIVVVNKEDRLPSKEAVLPLLQQINDTLEVCAVVPTCALREASVARLEAVVGAELPLGEWIYSEEQITDRSTRFVAAEFIREQFIERLGEEVPYRLSVEIEYFEATAKCMNVGAIVWVERDSQKAIVIGKGGRLMKSVGVAARAAIEQLIDGPVNLKLYAKVKQGWSDDERHLLELGYD